MVSDSDNESEEELKLQRSLEDDLAELETLETRLSVLQALDADDSGGDKGSCRQDQDSPSPPPSSFCFRLEELPFERICLYLEAIPFVSLQRASATMGQISKELLQRLEQHRKESPFPGPPLLLSLLHFSHCVQQPRFLIAAPDPTWGPTSPTQQSTTSAVRTFGSHARSDSTLTLPPSWLKVGYAVEFVPGAAVSEPAYPTPPQRGDTNSSRSDPHSLTTSMVWCPLRLSGKHLPATSRHSLAGLGADWNLSVCKLPGLVTPRLLQLKLHLSRPLNRHQEQDPRLVQLMGPLLGVSLVDSASPKQPLCSLRWVPSADDDNQDDDDVNDDNDDFYNDDGDDGDLHGHVNVGTNNSGSFASNFHRNPHDDRHDIGTQHSEREEFRLLASVREVVSFRGGPAGAWGFRQRPWFSSSSHVTGTRKRGQPKRHLQHQQQEAEVFRLRAPRKRQAEEGQWFDLHLEFDWEASLCGALVDGQVAGPLDLNSEHSRRTSLGWVDSTEFCGSEPTIDSIHIHVATGVTVSFASFLLA